MTDAEQTPPFEEPFVYDPNREERQFPGDHAYLNQQIRRVQASIEAAADAADFGEGAFGTGGGSVIKKAIAREIELSREIIAHYEKVKLQFGRPRQ